MSLLLDLKKRIDCNFMLNPIEKKPASYLMASNDQKNN